MSRHAKAYRNGVKVSENHGAGEWKAERLSSLLLVPLTVWGLWAAATLSGGGYDGALAWFSSPVNAALLVVTLLATLWHMQMGVKVIVEDYIHSAGSLKLLLGLNTVICLLLAAASVFFVARLALGSVPLPAGIGA